MRVLDIATGTGLSAEAALAAVGRTGHVTAADVSPAMAEKARERLGKAPAGISAVIDRHWVFFGLQRTGYCRSPTKRRRSAEREAQSQGMAARLGSSFGRKRKKPLLHATVMSEAINIGEPEFEGDSLSYFQSLVVIMPPARVPTPPPPARQAPPPTLWLPPAAIGPLPGRRRPFHSSGPAAGGDRGRARGDARGRDVCLGTALVHLRATQWATGLGY